MIVCVALTDKSLYVSAEGKILPCCYQHRLVTDEEDFRSLVATWDSPTPNKRCFDMCDDRNQGSYSSFAGVKNQWKLNNTAD
jgi:hypothetical protein